MGSGTSHFQQFNEWETRTGLPSGSLTDFKGSVLTFFFFVKLFSDLCDKICMIRIKKHKNFNNWGNICYMAIC